MSKVYSKEREEELQSEIQSLDTQITDLRTKMNDELAKDGEWGNDRSNAYMVDATTEGRLMERKKETQETLDRLLVFKDKEALPEIASDEKTDKAEEVAAWMRGLKGNDTIEVPINLASRHQRAQRVITGLAASAGETIATETEPSTVETLSRYGDALMLPASMTTASGGPKKIPYSDNSSAVGAFVSTEGADVGTEDISAFGQVTIDAHTVSSKRFTLSKEVIADSELDIVGFGMSMLLRRIGRKLDSTIIKGESGKVNGIDGLAVDVAFPGQTGYSAVTDFTNLEFQINRGFMIGEGASMGGLPEGDGTPVMGGFKGFAISRGGEKELRKSRDSDGRPLWTPSIREGSPNMIFGQPYICSEAIDDPATGKRSVFFGNFGYMLARYVGGNVSLEAFYDGSTAPTQTVMLMGTTRFDMVSTLKPDGNSRNEAIASGRHA